MNVAAECAYFAVNGQNEALVGLKNQFSSTMFPLSTTRFMFYSQMVSMLRFHEIWIFACTRISLASSFLLRNKHSALTRPNAIEGFVVVHDHVQSQRSIVTTRCRQRINSKPRTERIYTNCGFIFNPGKYYSLKNSLKFMPVCKLPYVAHRPQL